MSVERTIKRIKENFATKMKNLFWVEEIIDDDDIVDYYSKKVNEDKEQEFNRERNFSVKESCRQIINANKEIDEARVEYKVVCSYLNDVQKIELVEKSKKKRLVDAAKKIQKLAEESERFKKRKQPKIKAEHYAIIQKYEDIMVDEIEKFEEYEKDCNIVKSDLDKLEGERGSLRFERENLVSYQKFLKFFSKFVAIAMGMIYLIIGMLYYSTQINMVIPLVIATMVATVSVLYIVLVSRKNAYKLDLNEKKMNKLIVLFNKVKIKYFNSFNLVDYLRCKYNVRNSKELKFLWDKYIQEKEMVTKHAKSVELYDVYEDTLIRELTKLEVEDTQIWTNQVSAITNPDEMKQIKQDLDVRRESLKQRIDYNNRLLEDGKSNIKHMVAYDEDYRDEVISILKTYDINIS